MTEIDKELARSIQAAEGLLLAARVQVVEGSGPDIVLPVLERALGRIEEVQEVLRNGPDAAVTGERQVSRCQL